MKLTWSTLDRFGSEAKRFIVCSDDDVTIPEYKKLFGEENVYVFNRDQIASEMNLEMGDCYQSIRKSIIWSRNAQFKVAKENGYRYFLSLDDDTTTFAIRYEENGQLRRNARIPYGRFDELCEAYFRLLDSAPFLSCVAFSQGGDYIGGLDSGLWKKQYRFKAMNSLFCDTEKQFKFMGRVNEDVNAYVVNGNHGKISLTLAGAMLDQLQTQKVSGGMTDLYRSFGTWLKSIYSVLFAPSVVTINTMGNKHKSFRIHHRVNWKYCPPRIISSKYRKES